MADGAPTTPEQPAVERPAGALERIERTLDVPARAEAPSAAPAAAEHAPTASVAAAPAVPARPALAQKSQLRTDIEAALADAQLRRIYAALEPSVQAAFRTAAEKLAARLEAMFTAGDVDVEHAHAGIVAWLHVIPKVNRWFLIQEAKVKTDAVLVLARGAQR